jgi:peroxiredoxin Q/BCP
MVESGSKAPDFSLDGSDGRKHSLKEFLGRYLVLYFYPRDNTPGCTIEAKGFNSKLGELRKMGAQVVGVSNDSYDSHCKFSSKYGLGFLLLSDPSHNMIKEYGAYGSRGIFGMGTLRKTYIIDKKGKVIKVYPKVSPAGHEDEIMGFLKDQSG